MTKMILHREGHPDREVEGPCVVHRIRDPHGDPASLDYHVDHYRLDYAVDQNLAHYNYTESTVV